MTTDTARTELPMPEGLVRSDPAGPGWTRRRSGRGFSFRDEDGNLIDDPAVRARLLALAVPPAWQDVWLAPDERSHIQAVGTDDAGRRQYRYHPDWTAARNTVKHDRVLRLGRRLPRVRAELRARLATPGLGDRRVLATGVRMLDLGVFRAGGEEYAPDGPDDEGTFGLATLLREHVRLRRGAVLVDYVAKGGIPRSVSLPDPLLHKAVGSLLRRRGGGDGLLAYRTGDRGWHDVTTADLNTAVKELAGQDVTCKDLRTWNATVVAASALAAVPAPGRSSARERKRQITAAMDTVADHLGNTPTVARSSYVDPRVVEQFERGRTIARTLRRIGATDGSPVLDDDLRDAIDKAVVRLIRAG